MSRTVFIIPFCFCLVMSCAKPTEPESLAPGSGGYRVVSRFSTPGWAQDVVVKDTFAYVTQGEGGLLILSVADRGRPRIISICQDGVRGYSSKLAVKDTTVYVAANTFGVNVVDVRDPLAPIATASNLAIKPARSFHIMGDYLFTAISEQGVKISDISYPTQPDIRGGIQTPGYARALTTTPDGNYLLVACGEMGLAMYDVSDMQGGFGYYRQVGWKDTPGYAEDIVIMGNEPVAFLACGTAGVQVVDFSDTNNVHIIGSFGTGGYAKEIAYQNRRLYVTTELRGLQILSVESITTPRLVGVIDSEYALGLALDDRYVYVADEVEGLIIVGVPGY